MVDWQALEGMGGIATAVAVVIALVFGAMQLQQAERLRRQTVVAGLIGNLLAPHVNASIDRVLALPEDAPPSTFAQDAELRRAFFALGFAMEGIGVFVFERGVELHAVDRQMGGVVRATWKRVRAYVEHERTRTNPSIGEWWQWLVERMDEDPAPGKREGAHVAFRDWAR